MSLQEKILNLKLNAALAIKHANGWQKLIDTHGLEQATAFYKHLGLNHLEAKGFEYEGLTLSREPKEHEKIAVKGIAQAQEASKEAITKILMEMRAELIKDGLKGIQKLSPASYHELILEVPSDSHSDLRDRLIKVYRQGRLLVMQELNPGKMIEPLWGGASAAQCSGRIKAGTIFKDVREEEFDELDDLTDLTGSRVANDVQARLIAAMQRFTLGGLTGEDLINAVDKEVAGGSTSYVDRTASGLANRVISIGRSDEAESRSDEWDRVEYSALLDQNACGPCLAEDGQSSTNEDDLQPAPNPECEGGDYCRCAHVFIRD